MDRIYVIVTDRSDGMLNCQRDTGVLHFLQRLSVWDPRGVLVHRLHLLDESVGVFQILFVLFIVLSEKSINVLISLNLVVDFHQNSQETFKFKPPLVDESVIHISVHPLFWYWRKAALQVVFVLLEYLQQVLEVREPPCHDMYFVFRVVLWQPRFSLNLINYELGLHE